MKKALIALTALFAVALIAWAGQPASWNDLTAGQKAALKGWIAAQPDKAARPLFLEINKKPVTGTQTNQIVTPRDPIVVLMENECKRIAKLPDVGIQATDTPGQMNSKLTTYINNAGSADKPIAVFNAAKFTDFYTDIKTIDGSGHTTRTNTVIVNVYGNSAAKDLGLPYIVQSVIERALLSK